MKRTVIFAKTAYEFKNLIKPIIKELLDQREVDKICKSEGIKIIDSLEIDGVRYTLLKSLKKNSPANAKELKELENEYYGKYPGSLIQIRRNVTTEAYTYPQNNKKILQFFEELKQQSKNKHKSIFSYSYTKQ